MAIYLTPKTIVIRVLFSLLAACAALYGIVSYSAVFFHYDFLIKTRPEKPLDSSLVLIDTGSVESGGVVEGALVRSVVDTLIELKADTVIIQTPILGVSAAGSVSEIELLSRFDNEFALVTDNIQNLFDGIKTGAVSPADAGRFVEETIKITEAGKERLLQSTVHNDEELSAQIEKSQAAFGKLFIANDLTVQLIYGKERNGAHFGSSALSGYCRAVPDPDGLVRRVAPVIYRENEAVEHIIFSALKSRFAEAEISAGGIDGGAVLVLRPLPGERRDSGSIDDGSPDEADGRILFFLDERGAVLVLRSLPGDQRDSGSIDDGSPDEADGRILFFLDERGALLFDHPADAHNFKSVPISLFIDYAEANKTLYRLLSQAVSLAQYGKVEPELYPPFIYEKAAASYQKLMYEDGEDVKETWRDERALYLSACEQFFNVKTEQNIIDSFAGLIDSESLDEHGNSRLREMRDRELEKFYIARDVYHDLRRSRLELESKTADAFCVMGQRGESRLSDAEASLLLADALISGEAIKPAGRRYVQLFSALFFLIALPLIGVLTPLSSLLFTVLFPLLAFAVFSRIFSANGLWIDPLAPALSTFAGACVSTLIVIMARFDTSRRSRINYHATIPKAYLKTAFRHDISRKTAAFAAFAAVRLPDYAVFETKESADASAKLLAQFNAEARNLFLKAGAVLAGFENGLLLFAFGSPVERLAKESKDKAYRPVHRAALFLQQIDFSKLKIRPWHIGLDAGECVFSAPDIAGYNATGPAAARARLLAALAGRYNTQVLVSKSASEHLEEALLRKLDSGDGSGADLYFELKSGS